jgi:hypothetical protein
MRSRGLLKKADGRGTQAAIRSCTQVVTPRLFEKEFQLRFLRAVSAPRSRVRNNMCVS